MSPETAPAPQRASHHRVEYRIRLDHDFSRGTSVKSKGRRPDYDLKIPKGISNRLVVDASEHESEHHWLNLVQVVCPFYLQSLLVVELAIRARSWPRGDDRAGVWLFDFVRQRDWFEADRYLSSDLDCPTVGTVLTLLGGLTSMLGAACVQLPVNAPCLRTFDYLFTFDSNEVRERSSTEVDRVMAEASMLDKPGFLFSDARAEPSFDRNDCPIIERFDDAVETVECEEEDACEGWPSFVGARVL